MALLDREKLLEKDKLEIVRVDFGKDDYVFVRQMTGRERDRFERSLMRDVRDKRGNLTYERVLDDFRAKLVVNTICDESGKLLLKADDISTLSQNMSAAKLELLVNKSQELNRISEEDKEEIIKNLEDSPIDSSTFDSAGS